MIEYRPIRPADVDAVTEFAVVGMRPHLYPGVFCPGKVRATVAMFCDQSTHFNIVATDGGVVVGALAALVQERLWMERWDAHVICCRAVVPGVGEKMLRALRRWVDGSFMVQTVSFAMEMDANPRMRKLLARHGFTRQQTVMHYFKGD